MGVSCKSVSGSKRSTFNNNIKMKVAIAFALLFCAPAFAQLDLGKVIGNFKRPYQCDQCPAAFLELSDQLCTEMENGIPAPLAFLKNFIDVKGLCMGVFTVPGTPIVKTACQPFGLCPTDIGPVIDCSTCPTIMRGFFGAFCMLLPPLPIVNVQGVCKGINQRLLNTDYVAVQCSWLLCIIDVHRCHRIASFIIVLFSLICLYLA